MGPEHFWPGWVSMSSFENLIRLACWPQPTSPSNSRKGSQIFKNHRFPYYDTMYSFLQKTLIAGAHCTGMNTSHKQAWQTSLTPLEKALDHSISKAGGEERPSQVLQYQSKGKLIFHQYILIWGTDLTLLFFCSSKENLDLHNLEELSNILEAPFKLSSQVQPPILDLHRLNPVTSRLRPNPKNEEIEQKGCPSGKLMKSNFWCCQN